MKTVIFEKKYKPDITQFKNHTDVGRFIEEKEGKKLEVKRAGCLGVIRAPLRRYITLWRVFECARTLIALFFGAFCIYCMVNAAIMAGIASMFTMYTLIGILMFLEEYIKNRREAKNKVVE